MPIDRTLVTSATGTTSATIPTHAVGDLIVAFAFRDGSATPPSLPGGQNWSSPPNATRAGTTCSHRTAYKVATSTSEATGTFTNATSIIVLVIPRAHRTSPIGLDAVNSGSSTSINFPAVTPGVLDGGSFVLGFCGHRSTNVSIETPPSGMTNITSVSDATDECAAHITTNGTTGWSSTNAAVGGTSSGWTSHTLVINSAQNMEAGPGLQDLSNAITQIEAGLQSLKRGYAAVVGAPAGFEVDAVRMETTDWISSTVNWADSPTGSLFVWLYVTPSLGNYMAVLGPDGYSDMFGLNGFNQSVGAYVFDSTESNYVYGQGAGSDYSEGAWLPVFMDWKTDESAGNKILQIHIGDTAISISPTDDGTGSFSAVWSGQTLLIGKSGFSNEFDGNMAEFWLSMTRLDFSVEANRRKFYSATGKPVDVGSDGSTPTGSAPEVYLSVRPGDAAADFVTNRGTGNNFTQNGALSLASTSPSD